MNDVLLARIAELERLVVKHRNRANTLRTSRDRWKREAMAWRVMSATRRTGRRRLKVAA